MHERVQTRLQVAECLDDARLSGAFVEELGVDAHAGRARVNHLNEVRHRAVKTHVRQRQESRARALWQYRQCDSPDLAYSTVGDITRRGKREKTQQWFRNSIHHCQSPAKSVVAGEINNLVASQQRCRCWRSG